LLSSPLAVIQHSSYCTRVIDKTFLLYSCYWQNHLWTPVELTLDNDSQFYARNALHQYVIKFSPVSDIHGRWCWQCFTWLKISRCKNCALTIGDGWGSKLRRHGVMYTNLELQHFLNNGARSMYVRWPEVPSLTSCVTQLCAHCALWLHVTCLCPGLKISVGHGHCPTHLSNCPTYRGNHRTFCLT
jgi:hypothetical protein